MNSDIISKAILILIILMVVQIFQYYDDPFLNSHLNQLEFDSFLSLFSILLFALYSYCMENDILSIFLRLVMLLVYVRFLYLSTRILLFFQFKKLLQNKKIQNSRHFSKIQSLMEKTQICKTSFSFFSNFINFLI